MAVKKTKAQPKHSKKETKRPNPSPDMPLQKMGEINEMFTDVKQILEDYTASLRPLDRKRLNGVGIKKQGFIHRAYDYAMESPEFLPQYLTLHKFKYDEDYFNNCRILHETCTQIREILWNLTLQSADIVYTDALEYYAAVREAAKRRIDGAETIYKDLETFFKYRKAANGVPTEKKLKSDMSALYHSKRSGRVVVESAGPEVSGGKRKVLDEKFDDSKRFKETDDEDIE
jgi:hypothetical protein